MASSNRTENLQLNQWVGADKPKMNDFNTDNAKIDAAVAGHIANAVAHITAAERSGWNRAKPLIATFTGNGEMERTINIGFQPSFGVVFSVDKNIVQTAGTTGNMAVFSAFVSKQGCSQGAYIESNGFGVMSTPQAISNCIAKLNESGTTYVYMMFP